MKFLVQTIAILLLLSSFGMFVHGDGIAAVDGSLHGVTRENRQSALVEVHSSYEVIHLFLSIVSLEPGKNITVIIPLRTAPENITMENMTDVEFEDKHALGEVCVKSDVYNGGNYLWTGIGYYLGLYSLGQMLPLGLAASAAFVGGAGSAGGGPGVVSYHFKTGDAITVYNFTSTRDIANFSKSLNISLPNDVANTLRRYGSYHAMVLRAHTRAPVPESRYQLLMKYCPRAMGELRAYVGNHSRVDVRFWGSDVTVKDPQFRKVQETLESELSNVTGNVSVYTLREYFYDTLLSMYGYGVAKGVELSMKLPLYHGQAYYPLGTSPSWGASGEITVFFKLPDNMEFQPNDKSYDFVPYHGSYYYYWNYDGNLPDHDIYGNVVKAGSGVQGDLQKYNFYK